MAEKAYITKSVLFWGRKSSKYSIEDVALKLKLDRKTIENWEDEESEEYPTLKQLEILSKLYRRHLAVFYLPEPPRDFDTLRDFRKSQKFQEFSKGFNFMLREIQDKQLWMKEYLKDNKEAELSFIGRFGLNDNPKKIAEDILKETRINIFVQTSNYLNYLIEKIEEKGIFVTLSSNFHNRMLLDPTEFRGFAISDKLAPFIFINSADSKNAQIFTLIHELVHLWINSTGISDLNSIEFRDNENYNKYDKTEILCNRVTAEILMPEMYFRNEINTKNITINIIDHLAKTFNVSSSAINVRLLNLNIITQNKFNEFKRITEERFEDFQNKNLQKTKSKGGPDYYLMQTRRNSNLFTHLIVGNYKSDNISLNEASNLLNIKVNNLPKLEKFLFAK
jgi:Zn-dependent peptidase ImmA (M78 family)